MFYGREEELEILEKRFNSDSFEFGFLYGQRRIGKTSLIDAFSKNHDTLMFFASDIDDSSLKEDFSNQFFAYTNIKQLSPFASWDLFFLAIKDYFKDNKAMIVFDEYPNIIMGHDGKRKKTDFDDKLQDAIDHVFKDSKLTIVIMGSNVSFMENLIKDKTAPIYKRHTFSLYLSKLKWKDALRFVEGMSIDDEIKTLCLTDTYPYYLSHIDPKISFEDNLDYFFFNRDSLIAMDPSFAISSNISISGFYAGIIRCISHRINTIKGMCYVLKAESGKVSLYLSELIEAGIITKSSYYNSSRSTYYEINDRIVSFYFRFIQPFIEHIKLGNGKRIKEREMLAIDTFLSHSYENLCKTFLKELNNNGKLETFYLDFYRYKADNTSIDRSVEIDILAEEKEDLLIGECKFSNKPKGLEEFNKMKEDCLVKPLCDYSNKHFYIFSHNGFTKDIINKQDKNLTLISSKEMVS